MKQQTDAEPQRAHITLKAVTTISTDEGVFEAVISSPTVDRDQDIVEPQAMVTALTKWAALGKLVPLAWAHTDEVVGHIDPGTVRVENKEVIAQGKVDHGTPRGEETWRLVKSGTLSFSFGYLIPKGGATKRPGGRFHIKELDVFEISVVPVGPANNDTRVLAWKSALEQQFETQLQEVKGRLDTLEKALEDQKKTVEETAKETKSRAVDPLRQQADALALEVASDGMNLRPLPKRPEPAPEPELMELKDLRERSRDLMLQVLSGMET